MAFKNGKARIFSKSGGRAAVFERVQKIAGAPAPDRICPPPKKKFVGGGDLTSSIQVAGLVALMNPIGLSAMAIPVSGFLRNSTLHFPSLRCPQLHFASSSTPFLIILRHTVVTCLYPRLAISICCGFSELHGLLFSRLILLWIFVVDRRS